MKNKKRFAYPVQPLALPANIIAGECYRFTLLTPSLIRMEYQKAGLFEDRASQSVFFRNFAETPHTKTSAGGWLTIETEKLILTYRENEKFSSETLRIQLKEEPASCWHYGEAFEDLGGTTKTLDNVNGRTHLERGIVSRNGFSVLDDSDTLVLNEDGWVEVRHPGCVDVYFWGYGLRYKDAIKDFYRLTGIPPMLPAYALGNWWSRFYAYTQEEYQNLILQFEKKNIPFSVSVVDMDWHITQIPEEYKNGEGRRFENGWTGYTWNRELFPDYKAFLKFLKNHKLKTALNLHPAQGVACHEDMYREMARACGVDPESRQRVRFDLLNPEFMEHYFDILHHPYEEDGVDFWWMDWQQGRSYWWIHEENTDGKLQDEREILDPLWLLNHLHILDISRGGKRPMFFSRYSGPGSQRYPVGFSGDTIITWESLDFQPYFTATASNIGYSWWSHDIGGHMGGYRDDELCVRWLQLGVFSPINRLHSCNVEFIRREPWCFEPRTEQIMTDWLRLRHRLFPYIYTMNYRNHTQLEPLVQPLYYMYPKNSGAYERKNQFFFGSELMVAPITSPNSPVSRMGSVDVWLPQGHWFDLFNGRHYVSKAGRTLTVCREIDQYPVFAKAGAIVPLQDSHTLEAGSDLEIRIFPGADNTFTLYEDAGDGSEYQDGGFVTTEMSLAWSEKPVFTLKPACGQTDLLPEKRRYRFVLQGYHKDIQVALLVDGAQIPAHCHLDSRLNAVVLEVTAAVASEIQLHISGKTLMTDNGDDISRCTEVLQRAQIAMEAKDKVIAILKDRTCSFEHTLRYLYFALATDKDHKGIVDAIVEQLTLTEEIPAK